MKKTYIYCIFSLIILILGFLCILLNLFNPSFSSHLQNILYMCALCFILIGLSAYAVYHRKYNIMKILDEDSHSVITHWAFMPHTSTSITNTIKEHRHNALCTLFLTFLLILIFSCTFMKTYYYSLLYLAPLFSLVCLLIGYLAISAYFNFLSQETAHIIFAEDTIYFLDDLYTLHKSIYFLDNVLIDTTSEPKLLFIYGQFEDGESPYLTLEVPIPDSQLAMAQHLCRHYLDMIQDTKY